MEIRLPLAVGAVALLAFGGFTGDSADGDRLTCAQAGQIETVAELPEDERVAIERFRRRCADAGAETTEADAVDRVATRPVADVDPTVDQPAGEPVAEPPVAPVDDPPIAEKPPIAEPLAKRPDDGPVGDPTVEEPCALTPVGDPTVDEPGVGERTVVETPAVMPPVAVPPVAVPPAAFASAPSPVVDEPAVGDPTSAAHVPAPTAVGPCPPPADEDETGEDETAEDETAGDEIIEGEIIEDGIIEDESAEDEILEDEVVIGGETTENNVAAEDKVSGEDDVVIAGEELGPATVIEGAAGADVAGEEELLVGATANDAFAGQATLQPRSVGTTRLGAVDPTGTQTTECAVPSAATCAEITPAGNVE